MADNSSIPVASGNETFANKDIGGVKYPQHIQVDSTGAEVAPATQATLASILTNLADPATQTTLAAVLAKLTADPATDTTLGAIGALLAGTLTVGLPSGASTAANQSTGNSSLASILAKITADPATQTTLAAVLAKLSSDPATETTLASVLAALGGDLSIDPASLADPYSEYETVAASQTDQVLGATGAIGDYLSGFYIQPAAADCGSVVLKDGATTIYTFPGGGTTAMPTLAPIPVMLGISALGAGFSFTTGVGVSILAIGKFT